MPSRWFARTGLAAAIACFGICLTIVLTGAPVVRSPKAVAGAPASAFTLPDVDQNLLSLHAMRGRVVLLALADPARCASEQYARVAALQKRYELDPRVAPVTVLRTEAEPGSIRARDLCQNLAEAGLIGHRVLDLTSDVWRSYRVEDSASLFVIDAQGTIRHRSNLAGDRNADLAAARAVIDSLLPADTVAALKAR